jgi:hypothetical protein
MAQLTPQARAQLDAFKAVTVKHARLREVDEHLSLLVEEHTDATHVLLCGPGGVGKSKVLKVVAERFTREETDRFVIPILLLEPIPSDSGPYLRLDYQNRDPNAPVFPPEGTRQPGDEGSPTAGVALTGILCCTLN